MKKLGVLAVVLALAGMASAGVVDERGVKLTVYADGSAEITNVGGVALNVDAYEIWSAGGNLDPVGWDSIADQVSSDPIGIIGALGASALSYGELTGGAGLLAEGSLSGFGTFQPGAAFAIGSPVATVVDGAGQYPELVGDLSFFYSKPSTPGDKYVGIVEIIPEPATMGLLVIGGLGLLARRRR